MSNHTLESKMGEIFPEEMAGVVNDMSEILKRFNLPEEAQGAIIWKLLQSMSQRFEANIIKEVK